MIITLPSYRIFLITCTLGIYLLSCNVIDKTETDDITKIVILAGDKSHPATLHEYIKNARLIKVMLDQASNIKNIRTEICYQGWPEDPAILNDADLILTISDGRDGPGGAKVPFMTEERIEIMQQQVDRGCGIMTFHFSTFAPDKYGEEILDWVGGYFDWQNDQGEREWYSDITFLDVPVDLPSPEHPVSKGVEPFQIIEEYYYDLRFRPDDLRFTPIISVPELQNEHQGGKIVAWAIERTDGGRGFGTSLGHFYGNWKNEGYRKLLLNAIIWTAGMTVPETGVASSFYTDKQVTKLLYGSDFKALILTGHNYPGHKWQETTPWIHKALEMNGKIHVDISRNINDLYQYDLRDYDFLVFNYCNWEDPDALWTSSKEALKTYVQDGGGLMFIHFANGAFHFSLPDAGASDWPYYRKLCRRVWNHDGNSTHDKYGTFTVNIVDAEHAVTKGLSTFEVMDELYYNQEGDEDIHVLLSAISNDTGKEEPQAWVYEINHANGKNSRVFQTVLGHDTVSLKVPELQKVLSNAGMWLSQGSMRWSDL
jgi:type 1 glutamine amidotransferase